MKPTNKKQVSPSHGDTPAPAKKGTKKTVANSHTLPYEAFLQNSAFPFIVSDPTGLIIQHNKAASSFFGYTSAEFSGLHWAAICSTKNCFQPLMETEEGSHAGQLMAIHKDGNNFLCEFSSTIVKDAEGDQWISCMLQQVIDRQENKEEISLLLNNTREAFILVDTALNIVSYNNQFEKLYKDYLGLQLEKNGSILNYAQPERVPALKELYNRVLNGSYEEGQLELKFLDGTYRWYQMRYNPAKNEQGNIIGVFVTGVDITESKKSEERYKYLFHNNPVPMWIFDYETKQFLEVNDEAVLKYGYSRDEFLQMTIMDIRPKEDINKVEEITRRTTEGSIYNGNWRHQKKNGEIMDVEITSHLVNYYGRKASLVLALDVTEKLSALREQQFEKRHKESLINSTSDLIWSVNKDLTLITANDAFLQNLFMSTGIRLKKGDKLLIPVKFDADFLKRWENLYNRALAGVAFTEEIYNPASRHFPAYWTETSFNPIIEDGLITGIACYSRDITAAKNYEHKLVEINKKLETAQQKAHLGYWSRDMDDHQHYWSDEVYRIWELQPGKFELSFDSFLATIYPDDRLLFIQKFQEMVAGNGPLDTEYRILTPDGSIKYIDAKGELIYSGDGKELRLEGTVQDITERKLAEENIRNSEEMRRLIMNAALDAIICIDANGDINFWNPQAEVIFGWTEAEAMGQQLSKLIIPDRYRDRHDAGISKYFETGSGPALNVLLELSAVNRNKEEFPIELTVLPIKHTSEPFFCAFIRDISERKKAEKELLDAFDEKNTILESIADAFFAVDKNWIVNYWNHEAENMLQTNREDIIGKNLWEVFSGSIDSTSYNKYHEAITSGSPVHFNDYYPALDRWYEISAYPSPKGLSVYFKDITERKKSEREISISNHRYNMVSKATNDSIWDWDLLTGKVIRTGDGFKTLFGYEPEHTASDDLFWTKLVHPEDLSRVEIRHHKIFNDPTQSYWEDEYRFRKANGEYAYVYDKGYILRNEQGEAVRMIGATQDITHRKESLQEITRIQNNLDSLINTTTDLIWSIDTDLKMIAFNKAYHETILKLTGHGVKEGDPVVTMESGAAYYEEWTGFYDRALAGEDFHVESGYTDPVNGNAIQNIVSFSPIVEPGGRVTGVACFAKDITDLQKAATELSELNSQLSRHADELAASNSELERFAYVASHDLQEPLRMVSSFMQLLEKKYKGQLDETAAQYIHFAVDGTQRMKILIQDLLEYSRVGTNPDAAGDTDMNEVMGDVLQNLETKITELGAIIEVEPLPVLSGTRRTQMLQLLQNLVGNALKYHGPATPRIAVAATESEEAFTFSVTDNGIGIDPRFADKIFIVFQRLHNKSEYSGTGIGLSICKKIVEKHGGRIWVESEPGQGSCFYFSIGKSISA